MPRTEKTFIFGLNYQTASELAFYVPGQPKTVSINRWNRPNVYDYWWADADLLGQDAVGVLKDGKSRKRLLQIFDQVDPPQPVEVFDPSRPGRAGQPGLVVKTFFLYRCYGFKGGLRWLPRKAADIRGG
jgi:undecaprenyl-diphosphatase